MVYGARLLSECTLARTAGSNPALSASDSYKIRTGDNPKVIGRVRAGWVALGGWQTRINEALREWIRTQDSV